MNLVEEQIIFQVLSKKEQIGFQILEISQIYHYLIFIVIIIINIIII